MMSLSDSKSDNFLSDNKDMKIVTQQHGKTKQSSAIWNNTIQIDKKLFKTMRYDSSQLCFEGAISKF